MEKLFAALEAKHPGYKVIDIHFSSYSSSEKVQHSVSELDALLAYEVLNAEPIDISKYFN